MITSQNSSVLSPFAPLRAHKHKPVSGRGPTESVFFYTGTCAYLRCSRTQPARLQIGPVDWSQAANATGRASKLLQVRDGGEKLAIHSCGKSPMYV
jgi:hypothetical protein